MDATNMMNASEMRRHLKLMRDGDGYRYYGVVSVGYECEAGCFVETARHTTEAATNTQDALDKVNALKANLLAVRHD